MKTTKAAVLIIGLIVFSAACGDTNRTNVSVNSAATPAAASPATPATPEVATGKTLYMDNCAACHKENGTGGKMEIEGKSIDPDNLTIDKIKAFSDDKIAGYIRNGIEDEGMPAFKDKLSESQISQIIQYVRTAIQKKPV